MEHFDEAKLREVVTGAVAAALSSQTFGKKEAEGMILAAAKTAVHEHSMHLWAQLGFNLADARDVKRLHGILEFADVMRSGVTMAAAKMWLIFIGVVLTAFGILLWQGLRAIFVKAGLH